MTPAERAAGLESHFQQVKEIIQAEVMWEAGAGASSTLLPENLEDLVKFAYFGGFIDMARARRFLLADRQEIRQILTKWYDEGPGAELLALLGGISLV